MKTWKNLIIPAVLLAALIAGFVVYNYAFKDKTDPQETTAASQSSADAVNYAAGDIAKIHVLKKDGTGYSVTSAANADASVTWSYSSDSEDVSAYKFSQEKLTSFVSVISSCEAVETIADASNSLSEYGFEDPAFTVTYTLTSGEEHTLFFGNNSFDGKTVYCTLDNNGTVFTTYVIKAATCDSSLINFLDPLIISVDPTDVSSVTFKRSEDNLDVSAAGGQVPTADGSSSEFGWTFNSPFNVSASEAFGTLMNSVLALTVTSYEDLKPDDYAKYDLDKPAYTFDINLASGKHMQVMLSKDEGGIYYGATTESPAVFTLTTSALTGLQTPLIELIDPYLDYQFIYNVKNIEASFPEGNFSMDMDVAQGGTISDKDSIARINGVNAKVTDDTGRSYFAVLYEGVICMNITGFDFEAKPTDTKDITFTVTLKDSTQTIIDLAVKDENTYYAFINGEYFGFLVSKDEVYRDNGKNLYDYGAWAAYDRLMEAIDGDNGSGVYVISDS